MLHFLACYVKLVMRPKNTVEAHPLFYLVRNLKHALSHLLADDLDSHAIMLEKVLFVDHFLKGETAGITLLLNISSVFLEELLVIMNNLLVLLQFLPLVLFTLRII